MKPLPLSVFCLALLLLGCVNIEKRKMPVAWSQLVKASNISQFAGEYSTRATSMTNSPNKKDPFDDLGFFLSGTNGKATDHYRLVFDGRLLWLECTSASGDLTRRELPMALEDGALFVRTASGWSGHPLGGGAGMGRLYLYLTVDGALVGRITGKGIGLFLWIVPTIGFGEDWLLWMKVPNKAPEPTPLELKVPGSN